MKGMLEAGVTQIGVLGFEGVQLAAAWLCTPQTEGCCVLHGMLWHPCWPLQGCASLPWHAGTAHAVHIILDKSCPWPRLHAARCPLACLPPSPAHLQQFLVGGGSSLLSRHALRLCSSCSSTQSAQLPALALHQFSQGCGLGRQVCAPPAGAECCAQWWVELPCGVIHSCCMVVRKPGSEHHRSQHDPAEQPSAPLPPNPTHCSAAAWAALYRGPMAAPPGAAAPAAGSAPSAPKPMG